MLKANLMSRFHIVVETSKARVLYAYESPVAYHDKELNRYYQTNVDQNWYVSDQIRLFASMVLAADITPIPQDVLTDMVDGLA